MRIDSGGVAMPNILRNVSALTIAQMLYRGVSLVLAIALARYLGVSDQGTYGLIMNYVAVFGAITDLGIANLVIRDMNQRAENAVELVNSYLTLLVSVNTVLYVGSIIIAFASGYSDDVVIGIAWAGLGTLFGGVSAGYYAVLAGKERMKRIAVIQVLITLTIASGFVLVMLLGGRVVPMTIVATAAGVITLVLHAIPARRLVEGIRIRVQFERAYTLLKRGIPFALHVGSYIVLTKIDVVILDALKDTASVGVYTAAARLTYPLTLLSMVTAVAIFPVVSRTVNEERQIAFTLVSKSMRWLFVIGCAIAGIVVTFNESIVLLLYGDAFRASAPLLAILIWYIPVFYSYQVVADLLVAANKVWGIVWITLACLAVNVILNVVLIPQHGAYGAAWTSILTELLRCIALLSFSRVALGFTPFIMRRS